MTDLNAFIETYQSDLLGFLFRMCGDAGVAEELLQETFVRALKAAERFVPREASVKTWVYSIAVNLVRDHWRRKARWTLVALEERDLPHVPTAEAQAMDRVVALEVRSALLQLPIEQREAILLYYYHDLTYAEIAHALRPEPYSPVILASDPRDLRETGLAAYFDGRTVRDGTTYQVEAPDGEIYRLHVLLSKRMVPKFQLFRQYALLAAATPCIPRVVHAANQPRSIGRTAVNAARRWGSSCVRIASSAKGGHRRTCPSR